MQLSEDLGDLGGGETTRSYYFELRQSPAA
jgi:hypothetical protein